MKSICNYLKSEGFEIVGRNKSRSFCAFKYSVDDKPQIGISVKCESRLYYMNMRDFRISSDGELEFMVTPYLRDIIDFLKEYKTKRFKDLISQRRNGNG